MVARRSRRSSIQRARAASASSSTACSDPRRTGTARGRGPSRCRRASPRECAGSVDTTRTRPPDSAAAAAAALEQVVLPTPPLPPKNRKRGPAPGGAGAGPRLAAPAVPRLARGGLVRLVLLAREGGLHARDPHLARGRRGRGVALAHVADPGQEVALDLPELRLVDLPELQPHLRGQELLAQDGVVVELGV